MGTCIYISFAVVAVYVAFLLQWYEKEQSLYWVWDNADEENRIRLFESAEDLDFPPNMLWGVASAAHQIDGNATNSNWARFESIPHPVTKTPTIKNGQKSGKACDHWNRLASDTGLLSKLGVNSYRFSVDWAKLQPTPSSWDPKVIAHYHAEIDLLLASSIVPMITLHHFTHPLWFEDLGAFEKEENIKYFVDFAAKLFSEFAPRVRYWCTINEPEVFVTQGYFGGKFPPGHKNDVISAANVLKNMMKAHTEVYKTLKSLPEGAAAKIGLVKNIFQFDPSRFYHPLDQFFSWILDYNMNESILNYLQTGTFRFWMPPHPAVSFSTPPPHSPPFDFLGLNYYSHFFVEENLWGAATRGEEPFKLVHRKTDLMTDMTHPIYPEGLYRALRRTSAVNPKIPIIVTENGIADGKDDRRAIYIERYLYALYKAISEGVKVDGYFYWSLMDNFEWAEGYDMKFGLFEVNFTSQERTLRHGSTPFVKVVKKNAQKLL